VNALCVDASVVLKLVLKGESYRIRARQLVRDCLIGNITLIAPPLFECETDSVIQKRVWEGRVSLDNATMAYAALDKIPICVMTHANLRQRAREIAAQFHLRTVYDATYAALAELVGCEYWTADKVFYDAVASALPFVKYLPDYGE
jgi:predicted nucleic acid-binding protein